MLATSRMLFAVCCLVLAAVPRSAAAEWHFTPTFGVTFAGSTTLIGGNDLRKGAEQKHVNFGGVVSRLGEGVIGVEGMFIYTRHFFDFDGPRDPGSSIVLPEVAKSYAMALTGNVVLTVPKRWTEYFLRPYVSGGFGVIRAVSIDQRDPVSGGSLLPLVSNMPGFTIGGGAIGFLSQNTGVRFDVRYQGGLRREPHGNETVIEPEQLHLHYMTAQIGVVIRR
jgi:hypothetical protein